MTELITIALLGLLMYWLRSTLDQQKGIAVELASITVPVALTGLCFALLVPTGSMQEFGFQITPVLVFVFTAPMTVAGVRFCERMSCGEQPQLSDIFRLTTIVGLNAFLIQKLEIPIINVYTVSMLSMAYLIGDMYRQDSTPRRWFPLLLLPIAFFLMLSIARMRWRATGTQWQAFELGSFGLLGMFFAPSVIRRVVEYRSVFEWLGYWTEVLRYNVVRPDVAIFRRTLFKLWRFRSGVCFLNHGSFGAMPCLVQRAQKRWQDFCAAEPMDVLARETEKRWKASRDMLAVWLGASNDSIAFSENATTAMNELASWFPLSAGDEVLLTDHEYGAVKRIWERRTSRSSAVLRYVRLPMPFDTPNAVVEAILAQCNSRTRLVVVSHITSPTAVILPVAELCRELRKRNIAICIDGPHALLQERINLATLDCDFYAASCHKWLCGPLGSGFIYVHPRWHSQVEPMRLSWGRLPPAKPTHWTDELTWVGTRDYSPYLTLDAAIAFFSRFDMKRLDQRNHELACYARRVISETFSTQPLTPESRQWMGWMAAVWLPEGDHSGLQQRLWYRHNIEVPIVNFDGRYLVRVSCHLYNTTRDIDLLVRALVTEIGHRS